MGLNTNNRMSNDKLKIKEIKSTSDLGCTLDTERPWTPVSLPKNTNDIELMLQDGTTVIGWTNPVVAWRELEK